MQNRYGHDSVQRAIMALRWSNNASCAWIRRDYQVPLSTSQDFVNAVCYDADGIELPGRGSCVDGIQTFHMPANAAYLLEVHTSDSGLVSATLYCIVLWRYNDLIATAQALAAEQGVTLRSYWRPYDGRCVNGLLFPSGASWPHGWRERDTTLQDCVAELTRRRCGAAALFEDA